jgi:hypothetical protein
MQEDTVRVVASRTRAAERWSNEASRLHNAYEGTREEAEELRLQLRTAVEANQRHEVDKFRPNWTH